MVVLLCLLLATTSVEAIRVGTIGTQLPPANLQPSDEGDRTFCLNTANRANASGFISSVNYCYVPDFVPLNPVVFYQSTVGIYRPVIVDDDDEAFVLVDSFVITENPLSPTLVPAFRCNDFRLSPRIEVRTGYVFGVCSMNFGNFDLSQNIRRLIINAETNRGGDFLICTDDCGSMPGTVPDIVNTNADINRRIMLISANIEDTESDTTTAHSTTSATTTELSDAVEGMSALLSQDQLTIVIAVCASLGFVLVNACVILVVISAAVKISRKRDRGQEENSEEISYDHIIANHATVNYRQAFEENGAIATNLAQHPHPQRNMRDYGFQGTQNCNNIEMHANYCYQESGDNLDVEYDDIVIR